MLPSVVGDCRSSRLLLSNLKPISPEAALNTRTAEAPILASVSASRSRPPRDFRRSIPRPASQLGTERLPRTKLAARLVFLSVVAAVLGFAAYETVGRVVQPTDEANQAADEGVSRNFGSQSAGTDFPLPTSYGIYALVDSRLTELAPLPLKIPDHSNTTSGLITGASRATLPNGNIRSVIFNRDVVREIPEKILVRVIARIVPTGRKSASSTRRWTRQILHGRFATFPMICELRP